MENRDKIEITDDMSLEDIAYAKRHNRTVDFLEDLDCFSEYTPNMKLGDVDRCKYTGEYLGKTKVMLELPTYVVKNAIDICKQVNEKYKEYIISQHTGKNESCGESLEEYLRDDWGLTPFDVLVSAYDKTELRHYPEEVIEEEIEKFE